MEKAKRQRFSSEFRKAAVRKVQQGGRIAETARELKVSQKTLSNWVYASRHEVTAMPPKAPMSVNEMEMELYKLRSENTQLKIDKEILKKAAEFFVKESR